MTTGPPARVGVGTDSTTNSGSLASMTAMGVGLPLLGMTGGMFGIQQQRASFSTAAAPDDRDATGDDSDELTSLPDIDPTLTAHNVTLSKITSPGQSQRALEYLTAASGPSQESILARAGMIAIDLEGQLTLPQFSIPTYSSAAAAASSSSVQDSASEPLTSSTFTGIHSVQIAVPLAHLAVHLPLNSLYSSPQPPAPDLRPPVHVFYWHLEPPHLTAADKHAMMQHIKAILHYPGCTTIAHCKTGDEQALFMQHGIHLRPPIIDTQRMYLQWTQLSWRVHKAWQVVSECAVDAATGNCVFGVPPLNDRYLVPTHIPPPPGSSDDLPPAPDPHSTEGALHTSSLYTPLAEPLGDSGAGLNDVLAACHLPINPLKKRSGSKSDAAQFRYAVWDVAFLCQAYWHMSTALAYLSVQLISMQSLSPLNLSTRATSPWTGPLDPSASSSDSSATMPPTNDHPLVLAIAYLIHSLGQPTPHPSSLTAAAPLAADLAAIEAAFARKTSVPVRQRLSQRTGGVRQVIVDYPQYFRAWRVESGLDPAAAGQPVVWVSVVRMPPEMPGVGPPAVVTAPSVGVPAAAGAAAARAASAGTTTGKRKLHGYARAPRIRADLFGDMTDAHTNSARHGQGGRGSHGARAGPATKVGMGGSARQQQARGRNQVDEEMGEMFDERGNWIGDGGMMRRRGEGSGIVGGGGGGGDAIAPSPSRMGVRVGGTEASRRDDKGVGDNVDEYL